MDPVTQVSVGAAVAICAAKPQNIRMAAVAGALAGFLPDADVLIRSPSDPLLFLDYHRHFTHSLAFIPVGGALTAWICSKLSRSRWQWKELLLPSVLGWGTHGLLDSCTSYGTYLYWPFSHERVAWHVISIIDPLFTLPLLAGVIWAIRAQSAKVARAFLGLALAYIGLGMLQLHRAEAIQAELIEQRGHDATRAEVKPSMANNILFRAFYEHQGVFYVDAIRVPWWGASRVYEGGSHPALVVDDFLAAHPLDPMRRDDIARFEYFSAGFLIEDPRYEGVLSDFRYASVPNEIAPMWGVDVLGTPENTHLSWNSFQEFGADKWHRFWSMLMGRPASGE